MSPRLLGLEPLGVPDAKGAALVDVAADAGFDYVSMFAHVPLPGLEADPAVTDLDERRLMRERLAATGVKLLNLECFNLTPEAQPSTFAAALECGADLGALTATAIVCENSDRSDALRKYRRACDMAAEHNIRVNVEFFAGCRSLPDMRETVAFVKEAQRRNSGVVLDILHLCRTSGGLAGLDGLDPELIGAVQLCDGPATPPEDLGAEMVNRLLPGEGDFPILEILSHAPSDIVLGVEAPQTSLFGKVPAVERARAMRSAAGKLLHQ